LGAEEIKDMDERLRGAERSAAVMENNIHTLFKRLDDIREQIGDFISKAELVMTCRQEINAFGADLKSLQDWRRDHTQEYSTLIAEHRLYCTKSQQQESWIHQRLTKVLDWIVPALIIYGLYLFRIHGHGGTP
jgi:septal ring factor EnvC (AmiA/AmiB activator)